MSARERIHFVTGKLAEPALREVVAELAPRAGFDYSIEALGITVAALMTTDWVAKRVAPPPEYTRVMLPGYCSGDVGSVAQATGLPVERGPKELRDLPEHFGRAPRSRSWPRSTTRRASRPTNCCARPNRSGATGPT